MLEQLARVCATGGFRIHVHLDRKIDPRAYAAGRDWPDNLRFVDERHEIF